MAFVSLGGDGSTRPTFFELLAAERLMPSLKAATIYSLSVFAQRRHSLHRVLGYEDELFALITLLLDKQSLSNGSATFSDGLYGLRRAPYQPGTEKASVLNRRQQRLALLFQVGLPYLDAKLQKLYETHSGTASGPPLPAEDERAQQPAGVQRRQQWVACCRQWAMMVFTRAYPFGHAAAEGLKFCYQLLYLLDSTPFYTPILHLLGQHVVRVSGQELVQTEHRKQQLRSKQLKQAGESLRLASWFSRGWLQIRYILADHSRNALILSVFAFKLLEWWFTSAEQKLADQRKLPIPPPPPPVHPHPNGVQMPDDPTMCPICRQPRTNPAMAVASGYVFCYPCIFGHISQFECCPVTRLPTNVDHIRRLYYSH